MYDIIIIGAGVTGCAVARYLSRYEGRMLVLEKAEDVCCGTSKANSAIVHAGFDAAHGTVLYFDDTTVTANLQEQFPSYAANFPVWAQQANGMLQFAVWSALAEAGIGANLQHYNQLIDDAVREAFGIPENWKLVAQMPFGEVTAPAGPREHMPLDEQVQVRGL